MGLQSPASHHHKDVLSKYSGGSGGVSKPQSTASGKHLKVSSGSRTALTSSKQALIHPEVGTNFRGNFTQLLCILQKT